MEMVTFSREKSAYGMFPMQQKSIRNFILSFIGLALISTAPDSQQSTTLRYDRSTTCNCILESASSPLGDSDA